MEESEYFWNATFSVCIKVGIGIFFLVNEFVILK